MPTVFTLTRRVAWTAIATIVLICSLIERVRRAADLQAQLPTLAGQAVLTLDQHALVSKALIVRELRAMGTHVDGVGVSLIEDVIAAAYDAYGITSDPRTFNRDMPILSDVQAALEQADRDQARAMTVFTRGIVGDLFNHPSNIPLDNPLVRSLLKPSHTLERRQSVLSCWWASASADVMLPVCC